MAKPQETTELQKNLDTAIEQRDIAVRHLHYVEQWARYHDHGIRVKTIEVLKQLGAWTQ